MLYSHLHITESRIFLHARFNALMRIWQTIGLNGLPHLCQTPSKEAPVLLLERSLALLFTMLLVLSQRLSHDKTCGKHMHAAHAWVAINI